MMTIVVLNHTRGCALGGRVRLADTLVNRSRGFLFRAPPALGEGILLSPCKAVHMFGMRFPLDIVFISDDGRVVAVYPNLKPWRSTRFHGSARYALELPAGTIHATRTAVGDSLSWTGATTEPDTPLPPTPPQSDQRSVPRRSGNADTRAPNRAEPARRRT
jgi:uncharacterized protein